MSAVSEPIRTASRGAWLKSSLGVLLVAAAAIAIVVGALRQNRAPESDGAAPIVQSASQGDAAATVVTVYYFHGDTRCSTCLAIEERTERLVRERFAAELESGALKYAAVNFDADANRHFRDDYDLSFGSVVVQGRGASKPWENLAHVWTLIHDDDPTEFNAYLAEHIATMLESAG